MTLNENLYFYQDGYTSKKLNSLQLWQISLRGALQNRRDFSLPEDFDKQHLKRVTKK